MDGQGAYDHGGRWNSPGVRAVYLAETLSLAALELLVHIPRARVLSRYRMLEVEVDEQRLLSVADVSAGHEQATGDRILSGGALGFIVNSVVNPRERNIVLNPDHPEFTELVSWGEVQDFPIDPRLRE